MSTTIPNIGTYCKMECSPIIILGFLSMCVHARMCMCVDATSQNDKVPPMSLIIIIF